MNLLDHHLAQTGPYSLGIVVDYAKGMYIYDKSGKAYLDMISGLAVSALGHSQASILKAIQEQTEKHLHVMVYGEFVQESQMKAARLLTSLLPETLNSCYFVNSGTEANEAALKLAKRATGRSKIISFHGAYHGSTHGSLSISGNEYKKTAFRPLLPQVEFIELNNDKDLQQIDHQTACVILETIQADAGIRIPDKPWIQALREKCSEVGALLILDEIQAGYGRTGRFSAFEHYDIVPDILTLGKALGAGLPIGAMVSSKELMSQFTYDPALGHITTFGGHPLSCAAATAGLEYLISHKLIEQVEAKAKLMNSLLRDHALVKDIRYKGLLFAIEMENADIVQNVVQGCLHDGLIAFWFLSCPEAFRLAPPLTITEEEIREACQKIIRVLDAVEER